MAVAQRLRRLYHPAFLLATATILSIGVMWELAVRLGGLSEIYIAPPSAIIGHIPLIMEEFLSYGAYTLSMYGLAFIISVVLGSGIGLLMGTIKYLHDLINPFVGAMLVIPKVALIPLITLWLGYTDSSVVFFGVLLGVFPVILNVTSGVKQTTPEHILLAKASGHSTLAIYGKIILPAITPHFFTGLFFGSHTAQIGVIIMELKYGIKGLGYLLVLYREAFNEAAVFTVVALLALILMGINGTLWYLSRYYDKWRLE